MNLRKPKPHQRWLLRLVWALAWVIGMRAEAGFGFPDGTRFYLQHLITLPVHRGTGLAEVELAAVHPRQPNLFCILGKRAAPGEENNLTQAIPVELRWSADFNILRLMDTETGLELAHLTCYREAGIGDKPVRLRTSEILPSLLEATFGLKLCSELN